MPCVSRRAAYALALVAFAPCVSFAPPLLSLAARRAAPLSALHTVTMSETKITISEAEALAQVPRIRAFKEQHGKEPNINSPDPIEKRMAEALAWIRAAAIRRQKEKERDEAA